MNFKKISDAYLEHFVHIFKGEKGKQFLKELRIRKIKKIYDR